MKSKKKSPKSDDGSSSDSDFDEENMVLDKKEYTKFLFIALQCPILI